jgi:hypothetical protein
MSQHIRSAGFLTDLERIQMEWFYHPIEYNMRGRPYYIDPPKPSIDYPKLKPPGT